MKRIVSILLMIVLLFTMVPMASASQSKLVALTFDDGPGVYTERLLDGLEEKGVKATFFCLGSCAQLYPDTVRRIVADGHQVPEDGTLAERFKTAYAIAEEAVDSGKAEALLNTWIETAKAKKA